MSVWFSESVDGVDWERLALVFKRAPLGIRDPACLQEAFQNSQIRCFVWDGGELVGAGRAMTDGVRNTVIFDVALLPEYQGRGLGSEIMNFLMERSRAPRVLLFAAPGKETFYAKLGYRKMKTAMVKYSDPEMAEHYQQLGYTE
ncbi:MAG TPA: GNAT family N-acetyltransferase [Lacipirellulaceae bacterium]|jgi:ribosomal protein S18 acetylase RimI-like enzyme